MNKGYDYDGVITTGKYKPEVGDCIITGRTWISAPKTFEDMRRRGIVDIPVYFMPPPWKENGNSFSQPRTDSGLINTGRWKAMMIDETGVEEFFEDNQLQYDTIKFNLKGNCKITKV